MAEYYSPPPSSGPTSQTSTMALISLIAGIVSWFLLPIIAGIVAIITGHMAKKEIRASGGALTGDGLATGGLILGYVNVGVFALCICAAIALLATGVISSSNLYY
jgi:hypothetical protein